jgi:hypothetical protein
MNLNIFQTAFCVILLGGLVIDNSSFTNYVRHLAPTDYTDPEIKSFLVEQIRDENYIDFCKSLNLSSLVTKKSEYIFECSNFKSNSFIKYKKTFDTDNVCQSLTGFDLSIIKSKNQNCYVPSSLNINFRNINSDSTKGFTNW